MPSSLHPQAKFDPIPPDLDLSTLAEKTPNFDYVIRITTDQIRDLGLAEFEKLVLLHVIVGGKPLVVEGWNTSLPPWLFSSTWLQENVGRKQEKVRDIGNSTDIPMTIGHYLGAMEKLTKQWTLTNFRDPKRQRLYLKDIDCPEAWHQHLQNIMPQILFYLNDCVGEKGGPGALHERDMYNQLVLGKGIGPAGDLMSNLPPAMRAENMMCYIGHEGTYTPAHREMCATLGQNIMVETSDIVKGEKPGSSIWFMTESKDREVVSEYFLSMLGHDIEVESHFAQINAWKKAPFPVYIVEQKVGDLILIPPLAPHQVWNRGTRTMKVAWNRTTVETLELALHEALPRARMVCRDEQYKCKATIYYSLLKYYELLKRVEGAEDASWHDDANEPIRTAPRVRQLQKDFKRLFHLYTEVLLSETFSSELPKEKSVEFLPFDSNVTCSYCRCNIFNRFLTCKTCIGTIEDTNEEDTYDICMECYAMGRSCGCISNLKWVEQWHWSVLTHHYEEWRAMVITNDGFIHGELSPQPFEIARQRYGKKPVAQICQEQLRKRPWHDISKPIIEPLPGDSDDEPEVDDEGRLKKKKLSKSKKRKLQQTRQSCTTCHVCKNKDWNWKLAFCKTCSKAYCYGSLWRGFDLKPQTIMEDENWKCPKCLNICSCGKCRKDPSQHAYRPKGTLLGHDTRRVADPRSVESLVDFGRTNLTWLRGEGDDDPQSSLRMQKLMQKAQAEKERVEALEELVEDERRPQDTLGPLEVNSAMVIDPMLCDNEIDTLFQANSQDSNRLPSGPESHTDESNMQATGPDAIHQTNTNGAERHLGRHSPKPLIQIHKDRHQANSSTNGGYTAPAAVMQSSYPDPSGLGRDRMMGMGYYQQANDIDKILFDHPDASTPTGQTPNLAYPRLTQEQEEYQPAGKKRKRDSHIFASADMDEAHAQFLREQKKQKLAEAKKSGIYFMTQNKLNGGAPLTVKFRMTNSKDFLRRLDELDNRATHPRLNPRPARTIINSQGSPFQLEDEFIIVRSDVQDKIVDNVDRGVLKGPPEETSLASIVRGEGKRGRGRPSKIRPQEAQLQTTSTPPIEESRRSRPPMSKAAIQHVEPEKLQAIVSLTTPTEVDQNSAETETVFPTKFKKTVKSRTSEMFAEESVFLAEPNKAILPRRSVNPEGNTEDEIPQAGPSSIGEHRKSTAREGNAVEESIFPAKLQKALKSRSSTSFEKNTEEGGFLPMQHRKTIGSRRVTFTEIPVDDPATPTPSSAADEHVDTRYFTPASNDTFSDEEDAAILVDKYYNPVPSSRGVPGQFARAPPSAAVSEDYQNAKLEALLMVEAELQEPGQVSARPHLRKASPVVTAKAKGQHTASAKSPRTITKSLPKPPPGKLMSMAERRALQGKPFKIASSKPSPNAMPQGFSNTAASSRANSEKSQTLAHTVLDKSSPMVGSPPGDGNDSTPALRPVSLKPFNSHAQRS